MSESDTTHLPERFGRYVVRGLLGSGGMGSVYLAHDELLDREVAVKTMHTFGLGGSAAQVFTQRFFTEARAASAVTHPNVVPAIDIGVQDDTPYIVMELVRGPSLTSRIEQRRLEAEEARVLGMQIAGALAAAHELGILHRDVKPADILEAEPGLWKLTDFGVARVPNSTLTVEGQFLGSPAYAAPEAIASGKFSPASDVYGLGAMLYEALAGQPPYGLLNPVAMVIAMAHEPPRDLADVRPDLPPSLVQLVNRAIAHDPNERPSALQLAGVLAEQSYARSSSEPAVVVAIAPSESMARATADGVRSTTAITPGRRPVIRRKKGLARRFALGVAVVVLIVMGGTFTTRTDGSSPTTRTAPGAAGGRGAARSAGSTAARPPEAQEHWLAANEQLASGKLQQAESHLVQVLTLSPRDAEAAQLLDQVRTQQRQRSKRRRN